MIRMKRSSLAIALVAAVLSTSLSGCAGLLIGGVAVGALAAVDRRTTGTQIDDESIEVRGALRLREVLGDRSHVSVTSYNRQVLLTGEVPSEQARQTAQQNISRLENVRGVVNELAVMAPSSLGQRSSDTLITAKVKASLVDDRELFVGAFKVVTERSVVYLMGRVTAREADKATQLARTISGVQRVVRIFELISDDELRRLSAGTPAPVINAAPPPPPAQLAPAPAVVAPVPPPAVQTAPVQSSPAPSATPLPPAR